MERKFEIRDDITIDSDWKEDIYKYDDFYAEATRQYRQKRDAGDLEFGKNVPYKYQVTKDLTEICFFFANIFRWAIEEREAKKRGEEIRGSRNLVVLTAYFDGSLEQGYRRLKEIASLEIPSVAYESISPVGNLPIDTPLRDLFVSLQQMATDAYLSKGRTKDNPFYRKLNLVFSRVFPNYGPYSDYKFVSEVLGKYASKKLYSDDEQYIEDKRLRDQRLEEIRSKLNVDSDDEMYIEVN